MSDAATAKAAILIAAGALIGGAVIANNNPPALPAAAAPSAPTTGLMDAVKSIPRSDVAKSVLPKSLDGSLRCSARGAAPLAHNKRTP